MRRLVRARSPSPEPATQPEERTIPPELLRRIRGIEIRARRLVTNVFVGEYHAVFRGRGIEFSEVREYQPGDDVRAIDWNVTARLGAPYIKKYVEERELTVMLVVDVSASDRFGSGGVTKRDIAAEAGGLLAFSAIRNNDKVGLIAFSDRIERYVPPAKGARHVLRVIRELLYLQPEGGGTDIGGAADFVSKVLPRRSVVFLLSDFGDQRYERRLRVLARRHDVTALVLGDRREEALPAAGLVAVEDAETGEQMVVDTGDRRVRAAYAAAATRRRDERRRALASSGIDQVELTTDSSYVEPLLAYFRRRAGRQ